MRARHFGKGRGFTLVELLIAMAIIGILIALAAPQYSTIRRKALRGGVIATLSQLRTVFALYQSDLGEFPPTGSISSVADLVQMAEESSARIEAPGLVRFIDSIDSYTTVDDERGYVLLTTKDDVQYELTHKGAECISDNCP